MEHKKTLSRKQFLRFVFMGIAALVFEPFLRHFTAEGLLWQIDPDKCVHCGKCATACVLKPSAVKCVHSYAICGYCDLCSGYFLPGVFDLNTAAENQRCPAGAIKRTFIEDPYFEYTIDEKRCIGCSRCVHGCDSYGNGSLYLQVRHDRCKNCNECAIAAACPSKAFKRVSRNSPYLLKTASGS